MFDGLADGIVSENLPASRTRPTQSRSLAMLDDTGRKCIESISALVQNPVAPLFSDAGAVTELATENDVVTEILRVVN